MHFEIILESESYTKSTYYLQSTKAAQLVRRRHLLLITFPRQTLQRRKRKKEAAIPSPLPPFFSVSPPLPLIKSQGEEKGGRLRWLFPAERDNATKGTTVNTNRKKGSTKQGLFLWMPCFPPEVSQTKLPIGEKCEICHVLVYLFGQTAFWIGPKANISRVHKNRIAMIALFALHMWLL